ncbi:MAG: hypothetical protein ACI9MC_003011, partial [Kiritimatiellia bacterium]
MGPGEVHESVNDDPTEKRNLPKPGHTKEPAKVLRIPAEAGDFHLSHAEHPDDFTEPTEPTEVVRRTSSGLSRPEASHATGHSDDLNELTELLPRPAQLFEPAPSRHSDQFRMWYDTDKEESAIESFNIEAVLPVRQQNEDHLPIIEPVPTETIDMHSLGSPSIPTEGSFAEFLSARLVKRIRLTAIVLVLACVAGLAATPSAWLLLCLGMTVSGIIALLPTRLLGATAPATGTLIGLGTIVIVLSYFGPGMALTVAALTTVTVSAIIPLPPVHRTFQVGIWAAMFVGVLQWSPIEVGVALGFLGLAWWVGRQYLHSVRAMWRDRQQLAQLTDQLALESVTRGDAIQKRENELLKKQDCIVHQERW